MADTLVLNPGLVRLDTFERLYRQQSAVRLTPSAAVTAAPAARDIVSSEKRVVTSSNVSIIRE